MEITSKDVTNAVARLKRRKGISGNSDIDVTMIANEIGCSRNTLYKESLNKVMTPFKRIKNKKLNKSAPLGSIEYLKEQIAKRDLKIASLKKDLSLSKDWQIDQEVQAGAIEELKEDIERLQTRLDQSYDEMHVKRLSAENAALREQLLRAGLTTRI